MAWVHDHRWLGHCHRHCQHSQHDLSRYATHNVTIGCIVHGKFIIGSWGLSMVQGDYGPPYPGGCKQMPKGFFKIIIKT